MTESDDVMLKNTKNATYLALWGGGTPVELPPMSYILESFCRADVKF